MVLLIYNVGLATNISMSLNALKVSLITNNFFWINNLVSLYYLSHYELLSYKRCYKCLLHQSHLYIPMTASVLTTNQSMEENVSCSIYGCLGFSISIICTQTPRYFTFGSSTNGSPKFTNQISLETCFSK